jgi:hypothetical protein
MSALSIHVNGKKVRARSVGGGACQSDLSETNECEEDRSKDLKLGTQVSARDSDIYVNVLEEECSRVLSQHN